MAPIQGENTTPLVKKQNAAREVVDVLHEISTLLNTGLDRNQLSMCISMVENGVNPEALATVIKELRKEQVDGAEELERSKKQRR